MAGPVGISKVGMCGHKERDCLYLPLPPLHPTHTDTQTCIIYMFLCIIFLYLYCTLLCCILLYFILIYFVLFMLRKKNIEEKKFRKERTLNLSCGETAQADRTVETMRKVKAWLRAYRSGSCCKQRSP